MYFCAGDGVGDTETLDDWIVCAKTALEAQIVATIDNIKILFLILNWLKLKRNAHAAMTRDATNRTTANPRLRIELVRRDAAEREREGSAVKSIQRMCARQAVPYRETMAPAGCANQR